MLLSPQRPAGPLPRLTPRRPAHKYAVSLAVSSPVSQSSGAVLFPQIRPIRLALDPRAKAEMIGYKVQSLLGALPPREQELYASILQGRSAGRYTGEERSFLPSLASPDRMHISSSIKVCMRRRSPLNASRSAKCEEDEADNKIVDAATGAELLKAAVKRANRTKRRNMASGSLSSYSCAAKSINEIGNLR